MPDPAHEIDLLPHDDSTLTGPRSSDATRARRAHRFGPPDYPRVLARTSEVLHCQIPGDGDAVMCDRCADNLAALLREVPRVLVELNTSRVGQRGVDYRAVGGGSGGTKTLPLPFNLAAGDARAQLRRVLRTLVVGCVTTRARHDDPAGDRPPPRGDVPAMATWLGWRVDAMMLHPTFTAAAWDVADALEHALHVIDRPATRQDLGPCPVRVPIDDHDTLAPCPGRLTAVQGAVFARCGSCSTRVEAQPLRDAVTADLADRLCTAAEIADLVAYLAVGVRRDQLHARIRQWRHRGQVLPVHGPPPEHHDHEPPRFRFGDVFARLLVAEHHHGQTLPVSARPALLQWVNPAEGATS